MTPNSLLAPLIFQFCVTFFPTRWALACSDPCVHPHAMKQSPAGKLAMGREQLRGCSHSLLMQEVRRCELSPGSTLAQSRATNQVLREGCTLPLSPRGDLWQDATSALPTTFPHVVNAAAPHLLLMWMMPPCILLSNYPTGPVGSPRYVAAAHSSYHFVDPRFTTLRRSSLLIFWDSQPTLDHLTQARATLRPVRPSGRSPKQRCNLCTHLFSLRVPHESAHKVSGSRCKDYQASTTGISRYTFVTTTYASRPGQPVGRGTHTLITTHLIAVTRFLSS